MRSVMLHPSKGVGTTYTPTDTKPSELPGQDRIRHMREVFRMACMVHMATNVRNTLASEVMHHACPRWAGNGAPIARRAHFLATTPVAFPCNPHIAQGHLSSVLRIPAVSETEAGLGLTMVGGSTLPTSQGLFMLPLEDTHHLVNQKHIKVLGMTSAVSLTICTVTCTDGTVVRVPITFVNLDVIHNTMALKKAIASRVTKSLITSMTMMTTALKRAKETTCLMVPFHALDRTCIDLRCLNLKGIDGDSEGIATNKTQNHPDTIHLAPCIMTLLSHILLLRCAMNTTQPVLN
jgi:hypothetical protein